MARDTAPSRAQVRDLLEPGAVHPGFPSSGPDYAWDLEIAASQAISLKRIADALSGQGDNMLTVPINAFGENIGNAISGQIVRGMRGDDR